MSDLNVIRPDFKPRPHLVHDCQGEPPRPIHIMDALRAKQLRTRAELARDKIEEGYAELRAAAGADAAQECLRWMLLKECTP